MKKKSITIMVPAYNEEKYLANTVETTYKIVKDMFADYEILIFNDRSADRTGEIADALSKKYSQIKVIHNKENMGLGYNFRRGAKIAQKEYYSCIWADNDTLPSSQKKIFSHVGEVDFITSFIENDGRPLYRKIISNGFTKTLNLLFGLNLNYYAGIIVYKTELLKKVKMRTNSFAMQAEVIIQLLKKGYSHKEYSYVFTEKGRTKESNMLRLKNIIGVFKTIITLFFEIHFKELKDIEGRYD